FSGCSSGYFSQSRSCSRPASPHTSSSSPKERAYHRTAASTAFMWPRNPGFSAHSSSNWSASSRVGTIHPPAGSGRPGCLVAGLATGIDHGLDAFALAVRPLQRLAHPLPPAAVRDQGRHLDVATLDQPQRLARLVRPARVALRERDLARSEERRVGTAW